MMSREHKKNHLIFTYRSVVQWCVTRSTKGLIGFSFSNDVIMHNKISRVENS